MPSITRGPEVGAGCSDGPAGERHRRLREAWRACCLAGLVWLIAGCAAPPAGEAPVGPGDAEDRAPVAFESTERLRTALAERYRPLPGSQVFRLLPGASLVRIRVYRAGPLAHLGHNHLVAVRELHGWWRQTPDGAARADLWFEVGELSVDEPALRRAAGDGFEGALDPEAVAETRRNMLSGQVLAAASHPRVTIAAVRRPGEAAAEVRIRLRGAVRSYRVPIEVLDDGPRRTVRGEMTVRHGDFGLQPFSALGGALRVAEELEIEFRIVAEAI